MNKTDLCYLYDAVYSGSSSGILYEVSRDLLTNHDIGYLCRYACEYYLHWGPKETIQKLSGPVLKMMKLYNLVEEMKLPSEISPPEKKIYLCRLMYPEYLGKVSKEFFVTAFYQSVLSGKRKEFPHCFFSGGYGAEQNARICLMYALFVFADCHTATDCIQFMSSRKAVSFLSKVKLYSIMKRRYGSPSKYLNDALDMVGMVDPGNFYMDLRRKYIAAEK